MLYTFIGLARPCVIQNCLSLLSMVLRSIGGWCDVRECSRRAIELAFVDFLIYFFVMSNPLFSSAAQLQFRILYL